MPVVKFKELNPMLGDAVAVGTIFRSRSVYRIQTMRSRDELTADGDTK